MRDETGAAHMEFAAGCGPELAKEVTCNPAVSEKQRRYMGAAYGRAKAGHPRRGDPKMPMKKLREFASKAVFAFVVGCLIATAAQAAPVERPRTACCLCQGVDCPTSPSCRAAPLTAQACATACQAAGPRCEATVYIRNQPCMACERNKR